MILQADAGRRWIAADLRANQCELMRRRVANLTPVLGFGGDP